MQFLTPDMIGRIGTALELDRNKIQPAVSSAVPALEEGNPRSLMRDRECSCRWWEVKTKILY
jgi:hypothetical protein